MKVIFLFFICLIGYSMLGCSQSSYKIIYKSSRTGSPVANMEYYSGLVFNDSMSGNYILKGKNLDPLKKTSEFGDLIYQGHNVVYNRNANLLYNGYKKNKNRYIIFFPSKEKNWIITTGSKRILGYECRKAYRVNEYFIKNGERQFWFSDSTIAWYSELIKLPFGPSIYTGLPGVVLEVTDKQNPSADIYIIATKIEKDSYTISIPKDGILISAEEFRKINKH